MAITVSKIAQNRAITWYCNMPTISILKIANTGFIFLNHQEEERVIRGHRKKTRSYHNTRGEKNLASGGDNFYFSCGAKGHAGERTIVTQQPPADLPMLKRFFYLSWYSRTTEAMRIQADSQIPKKAFSGPLAVRGNTD